MRNAEFAREGTRIKEPYRPLGFVHPEYKYGRCGPHPRFTEEILGDCMSESVQVPKVK